MKKKHMVISASAGSGKTTKLAFRYIGLLQKSGPSRICAITFTRKAAGEILDSIVQWLIDAARNEEKAKNVQKEANLHSSDSNEFLSILRNLLSEINRVNIGTIDSLVTRIARTFPYELNIPAGFRPIDNNSYEITKIINTIIAETLSSPGHSKAIIEAYRDATVGNEEISISRNFIEELMNLRDIYLNCHAEKKWGVPNVIWPDKQIHHIPPDKTSKAAETLITWFGNLKNRSNRFLEYFPVLVSRLSSPDINTASVNKTLLDRVMAHNKEQSLIKYQNREYPLTPEASKALLLLREHYMNTEILRAARKTKGMYRSLKILNGQYFRHMIENRYLGFSDLLYVLSPKHSIVPKNSTQLSTRPLSQEKNEQNRLYIDYRLDARIDHWLIDEFQDTSNLQWDTFENLIDEVMQSTDDRTFFYVGDVKQSIFSFRGGNPELFKLVKNRYGDHIEESFLNDTRRCSHAVVDAVNKVFTNLPNISELPGTALKEWDELWKKHETKNTDEGYAALHEMDHSCKIEDRLLYAAELIKEIDPIKRGLTAAVLMSSNNAGEKAVEIFKQKCPEIEFVHEGRFIVTDNTIARSLISLVKLAAHPNDTLARNTVAMSPLNEILVSEKNNNDSMRLELLREITNKGFRAFMNKWGNLLLKKLKNQDEYSAYCVRQMVIAAEEFDSRMERDCNLFLEYIEEYSFHDYAAEKTVRVMTVHQAKGLGFDVVFMPELQDDGNHHSLGSTRKEILMSGNGHDINWIIYRPTKVYEYNNTLKEAYDNLVSKNCFDALCKLYVGMTRAKKALYLIISAQGGSAASYPASRLVKERLSHDVAEELSDKVKMVYESDKSTRDWHKQLGIKSETGKEKYNIALNAGYADDTRGRKKHSLLEPSGQANISRDASWYFRKESSQTRNFGKYIHELFEKIEWLESDSQINAIAEEWKKSCRENGVFKNDLLRQFHSSMSDKDIKAIFIKPEKENVEVWRERSFAMIMDEKFVSGIFDRVMIWRDGNGKPIKAVIVDYKSSVVDTAEQVERKKEHYRSQMELYNKALLKILGNDDLPVALKLIFTRARSVVVL